MFIRDSMCLFRYNLVIGFVVEGNFFVGEFLIEINNHMMGPRQFYINML